MTGNGQMGLLYTVPPDPTGTPKRLDSGIDIESNEFCEFDYRRGVCLRCIPIFDEQSHAFVAKHTSDTITPRTLRRFTTRSNNYITKWAAN